MSPVATKQHSTPADWSNFLRIGGALAAAGIIALGAGCERSDAEWRDAARTAPTPGIREVLQNPRAYEGREIKLNEKTSFISDGSTLEVHHGRYGCDYLNLDIRYEATANDFKLPVIVFGRVHLDCCSTYSVNQLGSITSPYKIPEGNGVILGVVKIWPGSNMPYLSVERTFQNLD